MKNLIVEIPYDILLEKIQEVMEVETISIPHLKEDIEGNIEYFTEYIAEYMAGFLEGDDEGECVETESSE